MVFVATRIWSNTRTLDGLIPELEHPVSADLAEVAVVGTAPLDLSSMPHLTTIFRCGVGTDNIDFPACEELGITVHMPSERSADIIYEETANFAVKSVLDGLYRWSGCIYDWSKVNRPPLRERPILLLGQGNIGRRVKGKLDSLLQVETWDPSYDDADELIPLLSRAEVVSLHMPLNDSTRGWFDSNLLAKMRDGSCLVNTARGAIVDELALLQELSTGRLRAVFDVFWEEPYHGPLREFHPDFFVMTPHIASHCSAFVTSLADDLREILDSLGSRSSS